MITKSYNNTDNNYSFGLLINRIGSVEGIMKKSTKIIHENSWASCSEYTRYKDGNNKHIFQFPVCWVAPHYRSEEAMRSWENEMSLMGSNAQYLGVYPFLGRYFKQERLSIKRNIKTRGVLWDDEPVEDAWYTWEIDISELSSALMAYHCFCMLRYIYSRHFTRLLDFYYDIKKKLSKTKPEAIEILQLAHYTFDNEIDEQRYCSVYCHLDISPSWEVYYLQKWKDVVRQLNETDDNLNGIFCNWDNRNESTNYRTILELLTTGKYKKAYELLKR